MTSFSSSFQLSPYQSCVSLPLSCSQKAVTNLAGRWLREPQRPLVHERVLDVEVLRIVEDSDRIRLRWRATVCTIVRVAVWRRDGDRVERNLDFSHFCDLVECESAVVIAVIMRWR